jgi:hypothetical protein
VWELRRWPAGRRIGAGRSYDVAVSDTHAPEPAQSRPALPHGIRPGQGRTGQRVGLVVAAMVVSVLTLLPWALAQGGLHGAQGLSVLAFFSPMPAYLALSMAVSTRHPEVHGDLLSTRTYYGRRTLDLGRLRKVRRLFVPGFGSKEWLILTDAYGVRLRLERIDHKKEKLQALVRDAITDDVDVSENAAHRLFHRPAPHAGGCGSYLLSLAAALGAAVLAWGLLAVSYLLAR